jgi:hypothetical protein
MWKRRTPKTLRPEPVEANLYTQDPSWSPGWVKRASRNTVHMRRQKPYSRPSPMETVGSTCTQDPIHALPIPSQSERSSEVSVDTVLAFKQSSEVSVDTVFSGLERIRGAKVADLQSPDLPNPDLASPVSTVYKRYTANACNPIPDNERDAALRLVHVWGRGDASAQCMQTKKLLSTPLPSILPEEGAPWDAVQCKTHGHLWSDTSIRSKKTPRLVITPKSDGVSFIAIFLRDASHPLVIVEPRKGSQRVVLPILDKALVDQFLALPKSINRLVVSGEALDVAHQPARVRRQSTAPSADLYLLVHDVLGINTTHLFAHPRHIRLRVCQWLGENLDEARRASPLAVQRMQMTVMQVKPFALTRDAAFRMLHTAIRTGDGSTLQDALGHVVTRKSLPPVLWFESQDLLFAVPVDGIILANLDASGLIGRCRPVVELPASHKIPWNIAGVGPPVPDPRAAVTKFRFFGGADFAFVPVHGQALSTTMAQVIQMHHYMPGGDPIRDGLSDMAVSWARRGVGKSISTPQCIQTSQLPDSALGREIRAIWRAMAAGTVSETPIVECVMSTLTREWIPVRVRTDKTRPNHDRVVRFAANAGHAYARCGGLITVLLRAYPPL